MHNKYTQPFRTRCKDLNLHGASKPKKHSLLSKYLLSNPPSPSPPILVIYVNIYFSERINIVGSK